MLDVEIAEAQRLVRTDAYQMSIGELVSMYTNKQPELVIDPEFQRLFRWEIGQKSKLVESILLGIPIPSIFVFERENAQWELVDGLQRISTILEFMGVLREPNGELRPPSYLEATTYLPSLHNTVWEKSDQIRDIPVNEQVELDKSYQLSIRRARLSVEILKRPSDNRTKYDLFQRLNAGGTNANPQELRNCIIIMVNPEYYRAIRIAADGAEFRNIITLKDEQAQRQRDMEYAVRFLVHCNVPYDGILDVEEYIDQGVVKLATLGVAVDIPLQFDRTFSLLNRAFGKNALRRQDRGRAVGRVTLGAFEGIAVGIGRNIEAITRLADPVAFVHTRIEEFWNQPELQTFTSPGLRGTIRIQRTVPFGDRWFRP